MQRVSMWIVVGTLVCGCKGSESKLAAWNPPTLPIDAALGVSLGASSAPGDPAVAAKTGESETIATRDAGAIAAEPVVWPVDEIVWSAGPTSPLGASLPKVDRDDVVAVPTADDPIPLLVFVEPKQDTVRIAAGPASWTALDAFVPAQLATIDVDALHRKVRDKMIARRPTSEIVDDLRRQASTRSPSTSPSPTAAAATASPGKTRGRSGVRIVTGDNEDLDYPERLGQVVGEVARDRKLAVRHAPLIAAHPDVPATQLAGVLAATEGVLLVSISGKVAPLRLQFARDPNNAVDPALSPKWIEVRVGKGQIVVEPVPDAPIAVDWKTPNADALAKAYQQTRTKDRYNDDVSVDVLVAADFTVQGLVDVLVALDRAEATTIGIGAAPKAGTTTADLRGQPIAPFYAGVSAASGTLTRQDIRKTLRANQKRFGACYFAQIAKNPELRGEMQAQLLVTQTGTVQTAHAYGIEQGLQDCVIKQLKATKFPVAPNGGNTQVNVRFSIRPT